MAQSVLIIGGGPVGMTLASELTRYGVPVRVVDKALQRTDKSKALVIWSRTLELLDRGGTHGAAPFVDAGFKLHGATFVTGDKVVGRIDMGTIPSPFAYALAIPQSETERLLEERLASQGVAVERGVEAVGVTFDAEGAEVVLRQADGREETVRTPWLVGCDGAHSPVRHALNAVFTGETLLSGWFLADTHMSGYPHPDTDASVYWHKEGVLIFFPIKPGRYRVIGDLPHSDEKVAPTPTLEEVQAVVDRRGPSGTKLFDPIWLSGYRINSRKVAQYRHGRVFLAGDAAHVHSPAGGQGMNTGMQDAMNLAWKLALVLHGRAQDALLDSYTPERSFVGDEVLKSAGRLTAVATLKSPLLQELRNVAGHLVLGLSHVRHAVADTMSEVAIHYPQSPLNGPHTGRGLPGDRVAPVAGEAPVGAGSSPKFAVFGDDGPAVAALTREFGEIVEADVRPALQSGAISLVRPDGHLACSAAEPAIIAGYLRRFALPGDVQAAAKGTG